MKNNLRHIAIAVIVVMAVLFAYQSWWLIRMYRSEVAKTENAVRTALRTCDFSEMMARLQRVRDEKSGIGFTGDITVGAGYGEGGTLVSQINTTQYEQDTLGRQINGQMTGVTKRISQTTSSVVQTDSLPPKPETSEQESMFESLDNMSVQMIRGMHTGIDAIDGNLDFGLFDSLLVVSLKDAGLDGQHKVELVTFADSLVNFNVTIVEKGEPKILASLCTDGYEPSDKAISFYKKAAAMSPAYCFPSRIEEKYMLEDAIKCNPEDYKAYYYLGNLLYYYEQKDAAIDVWTKSTEIYPEYGMAFRNLGFASDKFLNDKNKAIDYYRKAIEIDSSDPKFFLELDILEEARNVPEKERLGRMEKHRKIIEKSDDAMARYVHLLIDNGEYNNFSADHAGGTIDILQNLKVNNL